MGLPEGSFRFDGFVLDPLNLRLTENGETRTLEPKSFRLLQFLIENRQRVVPKEEILTVVWEGVAVSDNALTRAIAQIRKALNDDPKEARYIETVPTVGYRFAAEVNTETASVPVPAQERSRARVLAWGAAAVLLVSTGVGAAYFFRTSQGPSSYTVLPFTSYPGREFAPSFSPDGNQVAFVWNGEHQDNLDIYCKIDWFGGSSSSHERGRARHAARVVSGRARRRLRARASWRAERSYACAPTGRAGAETRGICIALE